MPGSTEPMDRDFGLWQIIQQEAQWINQRRQQLGRPEIVVEQGEVMDAVGLALSGGGIRSAAICLGVLQALNKHNVLRNIDYLSTVSGGGYIGSSLTATMTEAGGKFVLGGALPLIERPTNRKRSLFRWLSTCAITPTSGAR